MRIRCPSCGERDNGEFSYLGDAAPLRPDGMEASAEAMHDYVYLRDNRAGEMRELWYHGAGCRAWLVVTRDTRTHAIREVEPARDLAKARVDKARVAEARAAKASVAETRATTPAGSASHA